MPRPFKYRKVRSLPGITLFGPLGQHDPTREIVIMSIEEFESIRLIDLEGLTQEECASRMEVARGTVQSIYSHARFKIAESIVNGKKLSIEGGNYQIHNTDHTTFENPRRHQGRGQGKGRGRKHDFSHTSEE